MKEKQKLELDEKRLENQRKSLEIKEKKLAIADIERRSAQKEIEFEQQRKGIEIAERICIIEEKEKQIQNYGKELAVSQVFSLMGLLVATTIDPENTIFSSEPKYKPIMNEGENKIIRNKIIDLIKRY